MQDRFYIVPFDRHYALIKSAYLKRGFSESESEAAARLCESASRHGIRTHNGIKALHLDDLFGSRVGGCVPQAEIIDRSQARFPASRVWDAQKKLGQAVGYAAIEEAISLAEKYGIGQVSVDQAFHYLWGGGYVMEAAQRGYIAYTNCTAALAEVVPYQGAYPTLGTNPHSWGFPTTNSLGFPIVIDWATSMVAMGRVQQFRREKKSLPEHAAVDAQGQMTTDPEQAVALLPFGAHKGYGLSLLNELVAALIGGSLPTIRCRSTESAGEKKTPCFYFQVIHPEAISSGIFAQGRTQEANLKAVINDILGHGNEKCLLPGQLEAESALEAEKAGGLLFTAAEIEEFDHIARECGHKPWGLDLFQEWTAQAKAS